MSKLTRSFHRLILFSENTYDSFTTSTFLWFIKVCIQGGYIFFLNRFLETNILNQVCIIEKGSVRATSLEAWLNCFVKQWLLHFVCFRRIKCIFLQNELVFHVQNSCYITSLHLPQLIISKPFFDMFRPLKTDLHSIRRNA